MEITTREQARANASVRYWTGKFCKHGHTSPRYTASGVCCRCSALSTMAYNRKFSLKAQREDMAAKGLVHVEFYVHPDDVEATRTLINNFNKMRGL